MKTPPKNEKRVPKRSPHRPAISITLARKMLERIDLHAKLDNRTRSNWIVTKLQEVMDQIEDDALADIPATENLVKKGKPN